MVKSNKDFLRHFDVKRRCSGYRYTGCICDTECKEHEEKVDLFTKAIGKSRDLEKNEHLVSHLPYTTSEPCWRRKRWNESVGTGL